jgi:hypothetical protein
MDKRLQEVGLYAKKIKVLEKLDLDNKLVVDGLANVYEKVFTQGLEQEKFKILAKYYNKSLKNEARKNMFLSDKNNLNGSNNDGEIKDSYVVDFIFASLAKLKVEVPPFIKEFIIKKFVSLDERITNHPNDIKTDLVVNNELWNYINAFSQIKLKYEDNERLLKTRMYKVLFACFLKLALYPIALQSLHMRRFARELVERINSTHTKDFVRLICIATNDTEYTCGRAVTFRDGDIVISSTTSTVNDTVVQLLTIKPESLINTSNGLNPRQRPSLRSQSRPSSTSRSRPSSSSQPSSSLRSLGSPLRRGSPLRSLPSIISNAQALSASQILTARGGRKKITTSKEKKQKSTTSKKRKSKTGTKSRK